MARGINKTIHVGNLGQDPELRYTGNGTAVCNIRLAVNEGYKDKDGKMVDKTEWVNIVAWSRLAEICGEYLKKGSQVYFEGSLQTRSYDDKDGNTKWVTEIKAKEMMMLSGGNAGFKHKEEEEDDSSDDTRPDQRQYSPADNSGEDDDLPF